MSIRSRYSLGVLLTVAVVLSGCNNSDSGEQTGAQPDTSQPAQVVSDPTEAQPQGPTRVSSAETDLGTVLVSSDGFTLYIFTKDLVNTPSCYGDCMQSWPPLLTDRNPEAGEGIETSKLGIATCHDAIFQVSYSVGHCTCFVETRPQATHWVTELRIYGKSCCPPVNC